MSLFLQENNTIFFQRVFINTKSGYLSPEYTIGIFINQYLRKNSKQVQHGEQIPPLKRTFSIEELYDNISLDRPRGNKINLSEVNQSYNMLLSKMLSKENIFIVQFYPLYDQIQKLQTVLLEEILILFWILGCQVTIHEAYKKIEITFPRFDFQVKNQDKKHITQMQRLQESKYNLLSLFKHLLQQQQYQQQEFQLEQIYSDLFLVSIILQQNYQETEGVLERGLENYQTKLLSDFIQTHKISINQFDMMKLQKQVDIFLRSEQSITQYNLIKRYDTGLYIVSAPYNLTSQAGLRQTLEKYVIKKDELTQFAVGVDNLNILAVCFVLDRRRVTLDERALRRIEVVQLDCDRLKAEYLQVRRFFRFSDRNGRSDKLRVNSTLQNMLNEMVHFQAGENVTIERQADVGTAVATKSDKWVNDHVSAQWYLEKRHRLNQLMQGQNIKNESDDEI